MADAQTFTVSEDDDGIRLDRWFKRHKPDISFTVVAKWARTGQLRLNGKRASPGDRIETGQEIRIPPVDAQPEPARRRAQPKREQLTPDEIEFVRSLVIFESPDAFVLNKPPGLATQGGTKTRDHLDRLLDGLADDGARPKLVHRLDKDTSGAILVARSARAAGFFSKAFSGRTARKVYWALVVGVPSVEEGLIDAPLAKQPGTGGEKPAGGAIDVTADLPEHFRQSLETLGFEIAAGNRAAVVAPQRPKSPSRPKRDTRRGERRSRSGKNR
jgi:23S rRNA pseudouridine955/2504/2580 synthase